MRRSRLHRQAMRLALIVLTLGTLLLGDGAVSVRAAEGAEAPPFRAWWPIVNEEIEFGTRGFHTFDGDSDKAGEEKQRYGIGAGLNDWLFLELEWEFERPATGGRRFKGVDLESRIELTKTKAFNEEPNFVDVGLFFELGLPDDNDAAYEAESRLLLYKRSGPWRATANLIVEKEFGNNRSNELELAYAWQLKYRWTREIQPGFEIFGRFGEINDLSVTNQQHKIGPGLFGFVELGENWSMKYELGWLFGVTDPTPFGTFKWLAEIEYRY